MDSDRIAAAFKGQKPEDLTHSDILDIVHVMIQMTYDVAEKPEKLDDLIETWDVFFEMTHQTSHYASMKPHFERAVRIAKDPAIDRTEELRSVLELVPAPAVLADSTGAYIIGNQRGEALLADFEPGDVLAPYFVGNWKPSRSEETPHFKFKLQDEETVLASSSSIPVLSSDESSILIRFAASNWTDHVSGTLRKEYGLTDAEIDVAQLVHQGQSTPEIAQKRQRSKDTVRTQIKSILQKTQTQRQSGLVQFLSHLQYVASTTPVAAPPIKTNAEFSADFDTRIIKLNSGHKLLVTQYGSTSGVPVIYCTTSSKPEETKAWRAAITEQGLRVFALHRPGFGGSDPAGDWNDDLNTMSDVVQNHLGLAPNEPVFVAGHREGGIVAASLASRLVPALSVAGVILMSTGAPGIAETSKVMTRNTHAINSMPSALRLGYRAARRVFLSGPLGQRQIVKFFVKESPLDKDAVKEEQHWRTLRDNIGYCFADTDKIVDDIAEWVSDWAMPILSSGDQPPWHFIHGDSHDFKPLDDLAQYCTQHQHTTYHVIEDTAQLMIYTQPKSVVRNIGSFVASRT